VDGTRNLYVADSGNNTIRKITPIGTIGTNWVASTIAGKAGNSGSADGTNSNALFNSPRGIAVDGAGNLYVADTFNHTIRRITPAGTNWVVSTIAGKAGKNGGADGTNSAARFNQPAGVAVDGAGNLYVADSLNHAIREITLAGTNWVVSTVAGKTGRSGSTDGPNSCALFNSPRGIATDSAGNLYVADTFNHMIRKVTPHGAGWIVITVAGTAWKSGGADGTNSNAQFASPSGIAVDGAGNLFVADSGNHTIRKIAPIGTDWVVSTVGGLAGAGGSADGAGRKARFYSPSGVAVFGTGDLYCAADSLNNTVRLGGLFSSACSWFTPPQYGHIVGTIVGNDLLPGPYYAPQGGGIPTPFYNHNPEQRLIYRIESLDGQ
jgi:secreted PhoX family phosphatase